MRDLGICNLDLYITGHCNYQCEYCYGEHDHCPDMTIDTYTKALAFAKHIGAQNVQLCGGEPLVCRHFKEFTLQAKENGLGVVLRTNGYYLPEYAEFIANNCVWVGVSLDGLPAANDLMRPAKANISAEEKFARPIEGIRKLKEANPEIRIILASLASKCNSQHIPALAAYIRENQLPIDRWKIYEFICDKFRSVENKAKYEMSEADFKKLTEQMPATVNGAQIIFQSAHTENVGANCLIVRQNGDIKLSGVHYGNILTDSFDDIVDKLVSGNVLTVISNNKKGTYGEQ
ncbi:MAG: radical SAM protein [Oscillospiraceae bacterium]|nr:radical SAM protein [Oscillospiraceae bacterium]